MPSASIQNRDPLLGSVATPPISPSDGVQSTAFGSPGAFSASVATQSGDYDKIMAGYDSLLESGAKNPAKWSPLTPQLQNTAQSQDVTNSISNLSGLAASGGYSGADEQNIRARSISPIRSIYSSAQRGLDRSKALQGGYSPNFAAASAKMAREMSEQIGQRVTDVEGTIAQNRAQNKLSIAPSYASASGNADSARMAIEKTNTDTINRINELNAKMALDTGQLNQENMFKALEGKRGLYGTSPALINTFGNQVVQAGQLAKDNQDNSSMSSYYRNQAPYGLAQSILGGSGGAYG